MKKLLLVLIAFLFLITKSYSQSVEDFINMISVKLDKDKKYLNLLSIPLEVQFEKEKYPLLLKYPRTDEREPFELKFTDEFSYRVIFLNKGLDLDSLAILYIEETKIPSTEAAFFGGSNAEPIISIPVTFKDIYSLKVNYPEIYTSLYRYIDIKLKQNNESYANSLLKIVPDEKLNRTFGFASRDNRDFLRYIRANRVDHWYPREKKEINGGGRQKKVEKAPFKVATTLSSLSFSHDVMAFGAADDRGGANLRIDVEDPLFNLLPYQSMALNAGLRAIFILERGKEPNETSYIDASFLVRVKMATASFLDGNYIFNNNPFIFGDGIKLNFNTGIAGNVVFTRPFTLPNLEVYFSVLGDDFAEPNVLLNNGATDYAYFSTTQFSSTMSFFWNVDETLEHSFKFDLGFGYYDIYRVMYANSNITNTLELQANFNPILKTSYTFAPDENPFLNLTFKYFDSQLNIDSWLRVFKTKDNIHEARFYVKYITPPFFRTIRDWETEGGLSINLGYRYGL